MPTSLRQYYRPLQFVIDGVVLAAAFLVAVVLRFDFHVDGWLLAAVAAWLPFVILVQITALLLAGAHQRSWRYVGLGDLPPFIRAAFYATAVILGVRLAPLDSLTPLKVPLSIIAGDAIFAFGAVLGVRVLRRGVDEYRTRRRHRSDTARAPVLLVGAGRAGVLAVRELQRGDSVGVKPIAFVDDDPLKQGSVIGGLRVVGTTSDLPELVRELHPHHVVLTIADLPPKDKRRIVGLCRQIPIRVREIPGYYEIISGSVSMTRMRDVEAEQLLGREPVHLDEVTLREYLGSRAVLVTGAGGSIGAELCRQVARSRPASLVCVERAEYALFRIAEELAATFPDLAVAEELADVTDGPRLSRLFSEYQPDVVVHAAAHKHVPIMERHPEEAILNNVVGTQLAAEIAGQSGVASFILVSTDKAVNPGSVMGASKRVAEMVVQCMNDRYETIYSAVRFGNVLGSTGSVIPVFRRQIARGGPVKVTDPEMRRYFMSIPEAAQLVLRAGSLAQRGEIFVLDMGEPIRIVDLAEKMIELSGFRPHEEIEIVIIGRRPGEKLMEELGTEAEGLDGTVHPKIHIGKLSPVDHDGLERAIAALCAAADRGDDAAIRTVLSELIPEATLEDGGITERVVEA